MLVCVNFKHPYAEVIVSVLEGTLLETSMVQPHCSCLWPFLCVVFFLSWWKLGKTRKIIKVLLMLADGCTQHIYCKQHEYSVPLTPYVVHVKI